MRAPAAIALATALLLAPGHPASAQPLELSLAPILIIDQERLFAESSLGALISAEIEAETQALAEENRRIEQELIAEELDLTERRPDLPAEEFRALADAFDAKVQRFRSEQDAKERALQQRREQEQQDFVNRIGPVLGDLARERGAVAILDRRAVLLAAGRIDVTDEAIERLNALIATEEGREGGPPPGDGVLPATPSGGAEGGTD